MKKILNQKAVLKIRIILCKICRIIILSREILKEPREIYLFKITQIIKIINLLLIYLDQTIYLWKPHILFLQKEFKVF
jgi:hypothetical protein